MPRAGSKPRIVCISANPAMDRRVHLATLTKGAVNRATHARGFAGGKAAHVAMAARALAAEVSWIGFLGGAVGEECAAQLKALGIRVNAIATSAPTRVNLEILEADGDITEILEPGNAPTTAEQSRFRRSIQSQTKSSLIVISGSLPAGVPLNFYASIIVGARSKQIPVFLDTSGEALRVGIKAKPHFVKVNRTEAADLTGKPVATEREALDAVREIIQQGAGSAAVTLGKDGVVWMESAEGPVWLAYPPQMKCVSSVGCGDATLAGFAVAQSEGLTGEKAIRLAVACGAANCASEISGRINRASVQSLLAQVYVKRM
ncbi:MAG TPA: 1-phosphofructokinase family hexose kinase [Candidatus Acidoferrales bacterium]